jgi:hypothetical protein
MAEESEHGSVSSHAALALYHAGGSLLDSFRKFYSATESMYLPGHDIANLDIGELCRPHRASKHTPLKGSP